MGVVKRITYPGDGVKDDCEMLDMKTQFGSSVSSACS